LTLVSLIVLLLGYNYLKGSDIFSNLNHVYARYMNVEGLDNSKPVIINGFQVGKVSEMVLQSNGSILTRFDIPKSYKIPKNTIARLESTDLLGSKAIVLYLGNSKELIENGDTLEAQNKKTLSESLAPLQNQTQALIVRMDTFLTSLNSVINPNFQRNIDKSMTSIAGILKNLELASKQINTSIPNLNNTVKNFDSISRNLKNNDGNISATLKNFKTISDKFAKSNFDQAVHQLDSSLKELNLVLKKVNHGEGTMGALINDKQLYNNLSSTASNLNKLMIDLKANPKRYVSFSVFGGGGKSKKVDSTQKP